MTESVVEKSNTASSYQRFVDAYKAKVRPEGQLERMAEAFRLDAEFSSQFDIFRSILKKSRIEWGREIIMHLYSRKAFKEELSADEYDRIVRLYTHHIRLFRIGRFDANYLSSIEDIALFFLHHDVKSIWVAGAYRELTDAHIDLVITEVGKSKATPLGHSLKALTLALAAELNQIQRVYTMYERDVSESLIKDLTYGGMLTSMPKGRNSRPETK